MTKLIKVTPVEVTDPQTGETIMCCSRAVIDAGTLWYIFTTHLGGRMDLYQALTAVDMRRFDRKGPLSKGEVNRARNVFRAIEKYGRERGTPCVPINGRESAINRQVMYLNKDKEASNDYWAKRANAAAKEAYRLPRGKTGIRLAHIDDKDDIDILLEDAKRSDQISDTYGRRTEQLAEPLGMKRNDVHAARKRDVADQEAEAAHEEHV